MSLAVDGMHLVRRESRLSDKDNVPKVKVHRVKMPTAKIAQEALLNQVDFYLKKGWVDLSETASTDSSAVEAAWQRFLAENFSGPNEKKLMSTRTLDLQKRQISTFGPLTLFKKLISVNASSNTKLVNFDGLQSHLELKSLWLFDTGLNNIDSLPDLPSLTELSLASTKIKSLSGIERFGALSTLKISKTAIKDLSPLARLSKLTELHINGTKCVSLDPLRSLKKLQEIRLFDTPVADLSPLSALPNLAVVIASKTKIKEILPLVSMPKLRSLTIVGCSVSAAEKKEFERRRSGVLAQR